MNLTLIIESLIMPKNMEDTTGSEQEGKNFIRNQKPNNNINSRI